MSVNRLEDYDVDEEDEEALIQQRRLQRLAIVQVRLLLFAILLTVYALLIYCSLLRELQQKSASKV